MKKPVFQRHVFVTALFVSSYILQGLNFASLGPLLPEISAQAGVDLSSTGSFFAARGLGYMFGSIITAAIEKFSRFAYAWFGFWVALAGVCVALVPLCDSLITVCVCVFFVGLGMGTLDAGANAVMMWEFEVAGVAVDPWLHSMHFGFALGSFISPLLVRYITNEYSDHHVALWTLGGLYIFVPFAYAAIGAPRVRVDEPQNLDALPPLERQASIRTRKRRLRLQWCIVVVCGVAVSFYLALETGGGGYLYSYASEFVKLVEIEAAWINSAFWGMFAIGRLAAVGVSTRLPPVALMTGTLVLAGVAVLIPIVAGASQVSAWIAFLLLGFALGPCFPTVFTFCELNMNLSGKHTAAIVVAGAIGDFSIPLIMSSVFGIYSLVAFPMVLEAAVVLMLASFVVAVLFARCLHPGTRFGAKSRQDKQLLSARENSSRRTTGGSSGAPLDEFLFDDALSESSSSSSSEATAATSDS